MRRAALQTAAILLIAAAAIPRVQASSDKVWSGLVMAENVEKPQPVPQSLKSIEKTLVSLFGYNQFDVIGESNKSLQTGDEDWLAISKYFSLQVDANGVTESGYDLNLKLYQDKQLLLQTDTKLSKQSPLVIKGPQVGSGQLLLVLIVDDGTAKESSQRSHRHSRHDANPVRSAWRQVRHFIRRALP